MTDITSRWEFEDWLSDKSREWGHVIAVRAILRALPFGFDRGQKLEIDSDFPLILFRLVFSSWVTLRQPSLDTSASAQDAIAEYLTHDRKTKKFDSPSRFLGLGAYATARAVFVESKRDANKESVAAVDDAEKAIAAGARESFWENLSADCRYLEVHNTPTRAPVTLSGRGLWYEPGIAWDRRGPLEYQQSRLQLSSILTSMDDGYSLWIEWYVARVRGSIHPFPLPKSDNEARNDFVVRKIIDPQNFEIWRKGPARVKNGILNWTNEFEPSSDNVAKIKDSFFVSYAKEDESMAREIVDILTQQGHHSVAQFKDFPQGNFVREMREGIAKTDRFIAIQSKSYWKSDHCQSEWDAAYARDPGAKQRKILPFLLEPTELPPIASETVYQPLFNLSTAERREAVVKWIEYKPSVRSPEQLRQTLAEQASPDVRLEKNKIDAGPNTVFDKPLVDVDLAELPANLRSLTQALLSSLPANSPKIVTSCLQGYSDHLLERGSQPIVGTIDPFEAAIRAQVDADREYWDKGLVALFDSFFKRHELLIAHFPLNPIRELTFAETRVDEFKASGDMISDPVRSVVNAINDLKEADLTTEDYDRVEQAHQEFSQDIASLPMSGNSDDVTPKRRFVLGTIGFYERLLAALSGSASIASSAMGQAAIVAVKKAIEAFMKFIV